MRNPDAEYGNTCLEPSAVKMETGGSWGSLASRASQNSKLLDHQGMAGCGGGGGGVSKNKMESNWGNAKVDL